MATSRLRRWLRDGAAERRQLAGRGLRLHSEAAGRAALRGTFDFRHRRLRPERHEVDSTEHAGDRPANWPVAAPDPVSERAVAHDHLDIAILEIGDKPPSPTQPRGEFRSEEHTSELQSLLRISYAVFFLKKKK